MKSRARVNCADELFFCPGISFSPGRQTAGKTPLFVFSGGAQILPMHVDALSASVLL